MKKVLSIICAATMAVTGVAATSVTASAASSFAGSTANVATPSGDVIKVQRMMDDQRQMRRMERGLRQERREFRRDMRDARRDWRQDRREARRDWRDDRRDARRGFYRDRDWAYYNGHRGYRDRRRGYREYNGFWFPAAAFVAGAVVGGALNNNAPVVVAPGRLSQAHVDWCYDRYRSYRASDNTFQPYNGPRKACYSPYS